jgi:hypothetical protein
MRLFLGIAIACCAGCGSMASGSRAAVDPRIVELYGGQQGIDPILSPVKVHAYRIERPVLVLDGLNEETQKENKIGRYPIIAGPVEVDSATADTMSRILQNPARYSWDAVKSCTFQPGLVLRFTGKSSTTDVLVCFDCDQLDIQRDGEVVGAKDFGATSVLPIAKQLFPDDEQIQSLKTAEF